ncbi:MAG: hypothetical protein JWO05_2503 [Gemmatimonadetes bacterium]|nr:hypothetical protein [Gemmatimonadota bacterium]
MTIADLKAKLAERGVRADAYSFSASPSTSRYVLSKETYGWIVYSTLGDMPTRERMFPDESAACEFMLSLIEGDPTVMSGSSAG